MKTKKLSVSQSKKGGRFGKFPIDIKEVEGCERFADGYTPDLQIKLLTSQTNGMDQYVYGSWHDFQSFNYT